MFLIFKQAFPAQGIWQRKARTRLAMFFSLLLLSACQTSPLEPYTSNPNMHFDTLQGDPFKHLVALNRASSANVADRAPLFDNKIGKQNTKTLNVYIEGDGRPWHTRSTVAWDPTPKTAHMLALMALDASSAIYLGRPCYFSLADPLCEPIWWTHKRYSEEVIRSMNHVLDHSASSYDAIRLIGHSGGGALAMLIAAQRNDVEAVITLAGNIDIVRWTHLHNYSPMVGSLNPADYPLPKAIRQFHFVGSEDSNIPASLIEAGLHTQPRVSIYRHTVQVIEGLDHLCCWEQHWPGLLKTIEEELKKGQGDQQIRKTGSHHTLKLTSSGDHSRPSISDIALPYRH